MKNLPAKESSYNDTTLMKLVREVAMDIQPLDVILASQSLTPAQWEEISKMPQFQKRLAAAVEEWQAAGNTADRIKVKSLAFVEESLPEFFARIHDPRENLNAKTEVLKTISKMAGVGGSADGGATGEKLSVTINLGADQTLKIEKDMRSKIIEGNAL